MPGVFGSISTNRIKTKLQPFVNEFHNLAAELNAEAYSISLVGFDFQENFTHSFKQGGKTLLLYGDPLINGCTGEEARKNAAEILFKLECNPKKIALIDGLFSAVLINESTKEISIVNDRNGLAHIFYGYISNELVFASELRTLIDSDLKLTLREKAITEFMELGYHIENATYFNEISLLAPASILKYNYQAAEFKIENYFYFKQIEKINPSYAEAKVKIAELLKASINKRVGSNERVGVTLSGGLDSRLLFAGLPERDLLYTAVTRGRKGCGDIKIATQVARLRQDVKHITYDMNVDNWLLNRQGG